MTLRSVSILGSTGSVGQTTLRIIQENPHLFYVEALVANKNVQLLAKQAIAVNAKRAVIADQTLYQELKSALSHTNIEVTAGENAVIEAAAQPVDVVMAAIVGSAGLKPTMEAIKQGNTLAFANKECLVCAGSLMMQAVAEYQTQLIPVDSEHSAIFQVLESNETTAIEKIILTASGGPFRQFSAEAMSTITPQQAINHPNWTMGAKISVDSATMMNKGLELIEAFYLFPVSMDQIDIIVHPESVIHGMVQYADGSLLGQMGTPDMSTPIAYAMNYPTRMTVANKRLDLIALGSLSFFEPDLNLFPALRLAKEALQAGNQATIMLNAANEIAVDRFLKQQIRFLDIPSLIESGLSRLPTSSAIHTIDDVVQYDALCKEVVTKLVTSVLI